jgi:molybdopterin-guanine dinucleotide biosynthesis protein A
MPRLPDAPRVPGAPPPESIAGVILAGGRGARMGGRDKGWVPWQGRALAEHVHARLQPQVATVLVSANRNLARYRALGCEVIADDTVCFGPFAGPLAGMLALLERAPLPWLAFVPCDAPLLPLDLVARLAAAVLQERPAVALCEGRMQPVFCLLPRSLAAPLRAAMQQGERRPQDFLESAGAALVGFADAGAFANINALEGSG